MILFMQCNCSFNIAFDPFGDDPNNNNKNNLLFLFIIYNKLR